MSTGSHAGLDYTFRSLECLYDFNTFSLTRPPFHGRYLCSLFLKVLLTGGPDVTCRF